jgi:hypothetical protein
MEKESVDQKKSINNIAIGCTFVILIFFLAIHILVNHFFIPLVEKGFNLLF